MWMHNGGIGEYAKVSRRCRESLSDQLFDSLSGTTDSEMTFAMFINELPRGPMADYSASELRQCILRVLAALRRFADEAGVRSSSLLNFVVTDGCTVVATRYVDSRGDIETEPASLYYSAGTYLQSTKGGDFHVVREGARDDVVIIASEPLTDNVRDWVSIPTQHMVVVGADQTVLVLPIDLERHCTDLLDSKSVALSEVDSCVACLDKADAAEFDPLVSANAGNGIHTPIADSKWELQRSHTLQGHTDVVTCILQVGEKLFTGSNDASVGVWDLTSMLLVDMWRKHQAGVQALAVSADSRNLFSGATDGEIYVWDLKTLECKARIADQALTAIFSLAVLGISTLYVGQGDTTIAAVDIGAFADPNSRLKRYGRHHGFVYSVCVGGGSSAQLMCSGGGDGVISVEHVETHENFILTGHQGAVLVTRIDSEDSTVLYSGGRDMTLKVWSLKGLMASGTRDTRRSQRKCLKTLRGHRGPILDLCDLPESLLSCCEAGEVRIWEKDRFICVHAMVHPLGPALAACSSPKPLFFTASGGIVHVWDISMPEIPARDSDSNRVTSSEPDSLDGHNTSKLMTQLLKEFVALKSVSTDQHLTLNSASDCQKAARFVGSQLEALGAEVEFFAPIDGRNPIVLGRLRLGRTTNQRRTPLTVTIYGHYDVVPALDEQHWETPPFELTGKSGYLYGRGAVDAKGPIVATLFALKELQQERHLGELDVQFVYEGEEENKSEGMEECLAQHASWLSTSDLVLIMNTYWIGEEVPCLTYGVRGIIDLYVSIEGPKQDLHSGWDGGVVFEPFQEMTAVLASLVDGRGRSLVPGFYDEINCGDADDELSMRKHAAEFNLQAYKLSVGVALKSGETSAQDLLRARWLQPTLHIHQVNTSAGAGARAIARQVVARVSARTVPNQDTAKIAASIVEHIERTFAALDTSSKLTVKVLGQGGWWVGDRDNRYYAAASKACEQVWGQEPLFVREGGSIPLTKVLETALQAPVMLLPIGQATDNAHLPNERIRLKNLVNAKDVLKTLFETFSAMTSDQQRAPRELETHSSTCT